MARKEERQNTTKSEVRNMSAKFGEMLRDILKAKNISQTEFSNLSGIGTSSISQYISGKNVPSDERIKDITEALKLPEDYFKGRTPRTRKPYGKGNIRRLSLNETAHLMGISNVALANGIKAGTFPWAYAMQGKGTRYIYFINAEKFSEIEGIPLPMERQV